LPSFYDNFNDEKGISESELLKAYQEALDSFLAKI